MQIENIPLRDLRLFDQNPRKIGADARERLRKSLSEFGLFKPILVWGSDNLVIGGNQRVALLLEEEAAGNVLVGKDGAPCVRFTGDEKAARAVALRDNREDGEWSDDLPAYLDALRAEFGDEWDPALVGLSDEAATAILDAINAAPVDLPVDAPTLAPVVGDGDQSAGGAQGNEGADVGPVAPALPGTGKPEKPIDDYVGEKFATLHVGNIRGKIGMDVYSRFLSIWNKVATRAGSTEMSVVFRTFLEMLEEADAARVKAEEKAAAKRAAKEQKS